MTDDMREIADALLRLNAVIGGVIDDILDDKITYETAVNLAGAARAVEPMLRAFVAAQVASSPEKES